MKKRLLALALGLVLAFGAAACSSGESSAETTPTTPASNTVVVAIGSGFTNLDPSYCYEKYPHVPLNACYENLFKFFSNDGAPEPLLVDTYEFSEDNMSLTMTLKDGIVFASGNPMTSEDVKFSLMRCKNLKGNPSFITDTIASIDTPDEKTVVLNFTTPDSAILSKLTYNSLAILDSEVVKANGGTDAEDAATADTAMAYLNTTSAGSGMYVMTKYTPDDEIVLEKNPNYWGTPTNVDKYIIKIQPDPNTQMMTLAGGDVDIAVNLTQDTAEELAGSEGVEILSTASKSVIFTMANMDPAIGGPVADPKVQQAIRLALDYEGIQMLCGEGTVTPYSIIQTGFMGAKGERPTSYRNVEEAKKLLAEAGYPDGFTIDMPICDLSVESITLTDVAQKVQADLAEVGITANIVSYPWAAGYGDEYRDGTLGFTVMYWGIDYSDPNVQLEFLAGGKVGLRAGWTADMDPEIAAMYAEAMNTTDEAARIAVLEKIQDATYEYGPFTMIAQAPCYIGYNSKLDGVAFSDPYTVDLTLVNVK